MITAIFNFVEAIYNGIVSVVEFIGFLISEITEAVFLSLQSLVYAGTVIVQMPAVWVSAFTAIISIHLIFKLKG